jgi:hypothetical protein
MLCSPIAYEDVRRRVDVEPFHLLQGDVLFNVARLDPFAQCSNEALSLAARRASMTLIGWRVFGAVLYRLVKGVASVARQPQMSSRRGPPRSRSSCTAA